MIRFIFDAYSSYILMLGGQCIHYLDFYYLADFLKIDKDEQDNYLIPEKDIFKNILNYWKSLLERDADDTFLLYGLGDQSASAIYIKKIATKGRTHYWITYQSTTELNGWNVTKDTSLSELKAKNWRVDGHLSTPGNRSLLTKGIDWSLENLRVNTNPVEI